jgi:DMSO/TMAO reductase YedYZ heme-binding membrane subunit
MVFLTTLIITTVLAFLLKSLVKKYAWLFYALAIIACAAGLWLFFLPAAERPVFLAGFSFIMRRGYVALSLFTLVMLVGVFGDESFVRRALQPIRAEMSIIAAILIGGHFLPYLTGYLQMLFGLGSLRMNIAVSLGISLVLLALLLTLTITSFAAVRRRMRPTTWKKLQRLAYLFFLLIYAHLAGFLLPSALQGSSVAITSIAAYSVVFFVYAILRVRRNRSPGLLPAKTSR